MSRNESCFCGSGKKQKHCHPDILPESRAGQMLSVYAEIETLIQEFKGNENEENQQNRPPCHKGCFSCCYHYFCISGIEFKIIERELRTWAPEDLDRLRELVNDQIKFIEENKPQLFRNLLADSTGNSAIINNQIMNAPTSIGLPCPFLDTRTGACKIYSSRPAICRLHGTTYYQPAEYEICEFIPSNFSNSNRVPNAVHIFDKVIAMTNPRIDDKTYLRIRPYPIIFWLKLLFDNYDNEIIIPEETRDFRTPSHTAAIMEYNKYSKPLNRLL